jgi:hypothetical protein
MVALLAWLENNITLTHGEITVQSRDVPQEAFATEVDLDNKQLCVFANPDNPMVDTTLNVFLGYIIALAYDKIEWGKIVPTAEDLVDSHRTVCEAMQEFNASFAVHLEDHLPILNLWRTSHEEHAATTKSTTGSQRTDSLIEDVGSRLFEDQDDDKWRVN